MEVYAHLIEQRTGAKVSKMHLYYPKEDDSNPRITFPYRAHNIEDTIDSFEQVVRKIERRDFSMEGIRRTENQCKECDMRFIVIISIVKSYTISYERTQHKGRAKD